MFEKLTDQQLQKIKGGTILQPKSVGITNNGSFKFDWFHWILKK